MTMKTAYALLVAAMAAIAPCRAQIITQAESPLAFEITEWSYGNIREDGGPVSHVFGFTNRGRNPVVIERATASCGCTTPQYPRNPVAAGETGSITVTFDPMGYPGDFSKSITVVSTGGTGDGSRKAMDYLTITGHVTPRVRSVEEEYPHDMGGGVRFENIITTFRTIAQGHPAATVARYANSSEKAVSLAIEPVETSGLLQVHAPETVCAGCRGDITLTYDLSEKEAYGAIYDVLRVVVDGVPSTKTIYTAMTGVDDFSGIDMNVAPRFFLDRQFHDFGDVRRRAIPHIFRLTASNEGSQELHIRSVSEKPGLRTTLRAGMTVAPGATLPFEVMFYSNKYYSGALYESIVVVVDDPLRPVREIRISANIK